MHVHIHTHTKTVCMYTYTHTCTVTHTRTILANIGQHEHMTAQALIHLPHLLHPPLPDGA